MKDETLQEAKTLESNIKVLTQTLDHVERHELKFVYTRASDGSCQVSHKSIEVALTDKFQTVLNIANMLVKQFLREAIEANQNELDAL